MFGSGLLALVEDGISSVGDFYGPFVRPAAGLDGVLWAGRGAEKVAPLGPSESPSGESEESRETIMNKVKLAFHRAAMMKGLKKDDYFQHRVGHVEITLVIRFHRAELEGYHGERSDYMGEVSLQWPMKTGTGSLKVLRGLRAYKRGELVKPLVDGALEALESLNPDLLEE